MRRAPTRGVRMTARPGVVEDDVDVTVRRSGVDCVFVGIVGVASACGIVSSGFAGAVSSFFSASSCFGMETSGVAASCGWRRLLGDGCVETWRCI